MERYPNNYHTNNLIRLPSFFQQALKMIIQEFYIFRNTMFDIVIRIGTLKDFSVKCQIL